MESPLPDSIGLRTDRPLKIAFVAFQSERSADGGVTSLTELAKSLKPLADVHFVSQAEGVFSSRWRSLGFPCYTLGKTQAPSAIPQPSRDSKTDLIKFNQGFWSLLARQKFDVVVCNDIRAAVSVALPCLLRRTPLFMFIRGVFEPKRRYGWKWRFLKSISSGVLCLSHEMAHELNKRLKGLMTDGCPVEIVHSIIDLERMQPAKDESDRNQLRIRLGLPEDGWVVVYVAGFFSIKNQLGFIEHCSAAISKLPNMSVHFVGDFDPENNDYCRRCLELVNTLPNAHQFRFHGYHSNVEDWYRVANCTVLASQREGLARCMIESIACGTPVVSFDVTSAHEVLTKNQLGVVVPQGDYKALMHAIQQIQDSPEILQRTQVMGPEVARSLFSSEINARRFMRVITDRSSKGVSG